MVQMKDGQLQNRAEKIPHSNPSRRLLLFLPLPRRASPPQASANYLFGRLPRGAGPGFKIAVV